MTAAAGLTIYAAIGLVAGLVAAVREYQDGATPGDQVSAGAVGFFVLLLWPFVGLVVGLGITAHGIVRIARFIASTRPKA
jgi:hypothetical protein